MSNKQVVTRFAPSPTGFMHVGGVRTALFAWAYARNQGGKFILRIEDTDKKREVAGSVEHIIKTLEWLGLDWDEGPTLQSERLDTYRDWAQKLIDKELAYQDPFTVEQTEKFRLQARQAKRPFLFREHRPQNPTVSDDWYGKQPIRFKTPEIKNSVWQDAVRGNMHAGESALDDFILIKADGYPTYNFAHIIDDHLMGVTHIMRGEEFIASTPNYLALSQALGIDMPVIATMPAILGKQGGKKLSKRDGAKDVLDYQKEGYLSEAIFNYIASLGWNDGTEQEIFLPDEIVKRFSLERIQKSGARFDETKLDWVNWQHIMALAKSAPGKVVEHLSTYRGFASDESVSGDYLESALKLAVTKASHLDELDVQLSLFMPSRYQAFDLSNDSLSKVDDGLEVETAKDYLSEAIDVLDKCKKFETSEIESILRASMDKLGASPRAFLNLIRWAITNQKVSPNLFEMIATLGKEETIRRIQLTRSR